jgi:hypothetical protein
MLLQVVIPEFLRVGLGLLIVAEPVRFLLAVAVLRDIIADMPSAETLNKMPVLIAAHDCSFTDKSSLAKVGWHGIGN